MIIINCDEVGDVILGGDGDTTDRLSSSISLNPFKLPQVFPLIDDDKVLPELLLITPYEPMVTPESVEQVLIPDFQDAEYLTSFTQTGIEEDVKEEEEVGEEEEVKACE